MSQRLGLWGTLRAATSEHWQDTFILTGFTVLGGLAPLWFGPLLLKWFSKPVALVTFAGHGEFALYSAAIVAPALYTLSRDRGPVTLPARAFLILLAVTCLVLSMAAYAPIATTLLGSTTPGTFDQNYYAWSTVVLFVICLALFMAVSVVDNARTTPPVQRMSEREYEDLEQNFDKLGGTDASR